MLNNTAGLVSAQETEAMNTEPELINELLRVKLTVDPAVIMSEKTHCPLLWLLIITVAPETDVAFEKYKFPTLTEEATFPFPKFNVDAANPVHIFTVEFAVVEANRLNVCVLVDAALKMLMTCELGVIQAPENMLSA
jgi:hypothetical protein